MSHFSRHHGIRRKLRINWIEKNNCLNYGTFLGMIKWVWLLHQNSIRKWWGKLALCYLLVVSTKLRIFYGAHKVAKRGEIEGKKCVDSMLLKKLICSWPKTPFCKKSHQKNGRVSFLPCPTFPGSPIQFWSKAQLKTQKDVKFNAPQKSVSDFWCFPILNLKTQNVCEKNCL